MIITIIVAVAAFVATLSVVGAIATGVRARRHHRRRQAVEALPTYERLARGYERQGDRMIAAGSPSTAERFYRDAARVRREAQAAIIDGKQPLDDDDYVEPHSAIGNRPRSRNTLESVRAAREQIATHSQLTRVDLINLIQPRMSR